MWNLYQIPFFAVNYGIPTLELILVEGNEKIPVAPSSITYTVKYHTKFERQKTIKIDLPDGINRVMMPSHTVANDGDELTIRLDIKNSFDYYTSDRTTEKQWVDICAYTRGNASVQEITRSNIRTLTKDWIFNVTADFYFMTLFAYDRDDGKTCYYAGIKNIDVSQSTNLFLQGQLKYEIKQFTTYNSAQNTSIYSGLSNKCMPDFTSYSCCNFSYGCFNALAKIKTGGDEFWAWRDGMGANGFIVVRFYDDKYFDVERQFSTSKGWSQIYYHWCCTTEGIIRRYCSCNGSDVSGSCGWPNRFRAADITRYRYERINITK